VTEGWLAPEKYAASLPKAVVSASVFFTDEHDRPVQLHSVYSPEHPWRWPGGTTEAGEPWETAVGETAEQSGLEMLGLPRLLAAVFGLPRSGFPSSTVTFMFDGGRLTDEQFASIVLAPEEHDELRATPLEQWRALMPVKDFGRLTAVMEARRSGMAVCVGAWDWATGPDGPVTQAEEVSR
jgi:ADP-ribose pyrophosphatase YjhB (NUDIX family)